MPSPLTEKLKKENLDNLYLNSITQIKASRNSFFIPFSSVDNFVKEEKRAIFSSLVVASSLDKLILLGGLIGAAYYAAKGISEFSEKSKESSNISFEYSGAMLKTSVSLLVLLYVDVLNLITRSLATVFGNDEQMKNNEQVTQLN